MSRDLSPNIASLLKDLIHEISGFEENTQQFKHILKYFTVKLKKSGTTHFVDKRNVDDNVNSMCEKFCFHGFSRQATALTKAYDTYISAAQTEPENMNRLSLVKFLLCLSKSPTRHFLDHPEVLVPAGAEREEVIDWKAYLNEGIEQWNPHFDESSDDDSVESLSNDLASELAVSSADFSNFTLPIQIKSKEDRCILNLRTSRDELMATIQHTWYKKEHCFMKPESRFKEANIGILWEDFVNNQVQGLIPLKPPSIITEYIVIREVLWQLWRPHNSKAFELVHNTVRPRPDVTLASVRSFAFYSYLNGFIPYIELLEFFRKFEDSVQKDLFEENDLVARTYQSYCSCIRAILTPVYKQICDLEDQVRKQETTYTLINLADDLKNILIPAKVLKRIHDEVIVDPTQKSACFCAATFIKRLHESLNFSANKQEQDLKLTLFLESLYIYLNITESWLMKNDLTDFSGEFVIKKQEGDYGQFIVNDEVDEQCRENSVLKIFLQRVLEIGRNVNFLRCLGKHNDTVKLKNSIFQEFIEKVLQKIEEFNISAAAPYQTSTEPNISTDSTEIKTSTMDLIKDLNWCETSDEPDYIYPVIGEDIPRTNPDLQKLDNMIDISDGFLMAAFESFFIKKPQEEAKSISTLHERISKTTTHLFPKTNFFEPILMEIIENRFSGTGLLVKNLLVQDHFLEKLFNFLNHLYLFFDDVISPLYRSIFNQAEISSKYRPNNVWLTSKLHDIFMDLYPEFYLNCSVQVIHPARYLNSLESCSSVRLDFEISWPLNAIITRDHLENYNRIFQFLLKLKWALYTLNHMSLSDMGSNFDDSVRKTVKPNLKNKSIAQLIRLKFCLINAMNSLQHFVFGLVFAKAVLDFQLQLEKAHDLDSLIAPHDKFIKALTRTIQDLQGQMLGKDENSNVLSCIKLLNLMWNDLKLAKPGLIDSCYKMYDTFQRDINPVIFPLYKYDC
ncbi:gamma-tubulin complex component 5 [Euwallacea similis]|uniref:gamma-tubulin complex component 5 n=1 Tax=Euwallacea similis TaxID=1736056 RepID=UPI00344FFF53